MAIVFAKYQDRVAYPSGKLTEVGAMVQGQCVCHYKLCIFTGACIATDKASVIVKTELFALLVKCTEILMSLLCFHTSLSPE